MAGYELKVPWGCAVQPAQIEDALRKHPDARAVMMQASETFTTAVHPAAIYCRLITVPGAM